MNNINEILKCIELNAQQHLSGDVLTEINSKIERCRSKKNDEKLYLALVGEFSSGKSTFINALLGFRLLKEAVMPTTACATYIQSKGKILAINVTFFDGKKFKATSSKFEEIASYLASKYNRVRSTLLEIIEDITSDQTIAKTVKELEILVPNAKIPHNVVLIDTPGFNPGAESVNNHYEITKRVVEDIADAALVLTPQEQAMSATLIRFLKETLHRCLHRCYFVITKMDNSEPDHRTTIENYVKQRIISDLRVSNPKLYAESAITMLPVKTIPSHKAEDWAFYSKMFEQFQDELWDNIRRSKDIVLKEHIYNLVREIVQQCSMKIKEREVIVKKDKEFLGAHKIESIQNVCNDMTSQSEGAMDKALKKVTISFNLAEVSSKERAKKIIDECSSVSDFKPNLPSIRNIVESNAKERLEVIQRDLNREISQCLDKEVQKMQKTFASHYDSFPALRPKGYTLQTDLIRFNTTTDMSFDIALSKVDELTQREGRAIDIGAIAGAVIGGLLTGGLGAILLGGGLGLFGGAMAGDQADNMRASVKPLVNKEITFFFISLKIKVENEMENIKTCYKNLITALVNEHIRRYGEAVETLILNRENRIKTLDSQIKQLRESVTTLATIQENIEEELGTLRLKN